MFQHINTGMSNLQHCHNHIHPLESSVVYKTATAQGVLVAEGAALSVQTTVLVVTVRYGAWLMTVFNICVAVNTAPAESGGGGGITLASACDSTR